MAEQQNLYNKMSMSLEEALFLKNITVEYDDNSFVPNIQLMSDLDFNGQIRDRIMGRLDYLRKRGRSFTFQSPMFYKMEIGDLNGKQVLRTLISITNNENWMKDGNCFVFHVNNEPDTLLNVYCRYNAEPRSAVVESEEEKGNWARAFDDKTCAERRNDPKFFGLDSQTIDEFRFTLPKEFETFMQNKMVDLQPKYRRLFFGIMFEIAKCHVKSWRVYEQLKEFPQSALIKLAIDNGCSGKLQAVFNGMFRNYSVMQKVGDRDEKIARIHREKAELRLQGAKSIVDSVFSPNADGKYDYEEVRRVADVIKRFYE